MIAPALAPATHFHVLIGFVGCSANPQSAPASASPLTPPPRKTPSASVIQDTLAPLITAAVHMTSRRPAREPVRAAWIRLCYCVVTTQQRDFQCRSFSRQLDAEQREREEQAESGEAERDDAPRMTLPFEGLPADLRPENDQPRGRTHGHDDHRREDGDPLPPAHGSSLVARISSTRGRRELLVR